MPGSKLPSSGLCDPASSLLSPPPRGRSCPLGCGGPWRAGPWEGREWSRQGLRGQAGALGITIGLVESPRAQGTGYAATAGMWWAPSAGSGGHCIKRQDRAPSSCGLLLDLHWRSPGPGSGYPAQAAWSRCPKVLPALLRTRCCCHRTVETPGPFPERGSWRGPPWPTALLGTCLAPPSSPTPPAPALPTSGERSWKRAGLDPPCPRRGHHTSSVQQAVGGPLD